MMRFQGRKRATYDRGRSRFLGAWAFSLLVLLSGAAARATPSQNDVFKSIQDSVGERTDFDSRPVILLVAGGGLVMLVLMVLNRRQKKEVVHKTLNHPGRLVKEVLKEVPLKPAEMKQLKMLADSIEAEVGETPSPLAMLLCPSLLAKGLKAGPGKVDRKSVAQVVRKMKLNQ